MNRKRVFLSVSACVVVAAVCVAVYIYGRGVWHPVYTRVFGGKTVAEVVQDIGPEARKRMRPSFESAGIKYPPSRITFLAIKDSAILEVWAWKDQAPVYIRAYDIQALSGTNGPKLREGDRQVPEGFYRIEGLNPNSSYHLSMKLNYPNEFDRKHAEAEGRRDPGSNIFIHGKAVSIGCLAMGDQVIEELFVLTHDVGTANCKVVIAPSDPRKHSLPIPESPAWVSELYKTIALEFLKYGQDKI